MINYILILLLILRVDSLAGAYPKKVNLFCTVFMWFDSGFFERKKGESVLSLASGT